MICLYIEVARLSKSTFHNDASMFDPPPVPLLHARRAGSPSSADVEASPRTTDADIVGRIDHAAPPVSSLSICRDRGQGFDVPPTDIHADATFMPMPCPSYSLRSTMQLLVVHRMLSSIRLLQVSLLGPRICRHLCGYFSGSAPSSRLVSLPHGFGEDVIAHSCLLIACSCVLTCVESLRIVSLPLGLGEDVVAHKSRVIRDRNACQRWLPPLRARVCHAELKFLLVLLLS
jgi:hypothetical protein